MYHILMISCIYLVKVKIFEFSKTKSDIYFEIDGLYIRVRLKDVLNLTRVPISVFTTRCGYRVVEGIDLDSHLSVLI
jgi:hypothetical protein